MSLLLGLVFTCIAAGIALGAATGRYHYVVDVMTGIAVGLLAPLAATLALGLTALPHAATALTRPAMPISGFLAMIRLTGASRLGGPGGYPRIRSLTNERRAQDIVALRRYLIIQR